MVKPERRRPVPRPPALPRRAREGRVGAVALASMLGWLAIGCGAGGEGGAARIVYEPHTVLDIPTVVDADGSPDVADPHVIRVDGTWYLYATQSKGGLDVWTSEDLARWTHRGPVWEPVAGAWNARGQAWAPHVERTVEGYYLYYTADMRIGVARSPSPLGPFEEVYDHPLVGSGYGGVGDGVERWPDPLGLLDFDELAIDAFVLRASDGSLTLYFSAYTPLSVIWAVPMVDYVTLEDVDPVPLLRPGVVNWESFIVEGTWVIEHEGTFHLMYSGNGANTPNYAVGVAVGPSPLGPFVKRTGTNPILHRGEDEAAAFWGPGHHSVVEGAFGDMLMFYHTKTNPQINFDRRIRYVPISFDEAGQIRLEVAQP